MSLGTVEFAEAVALGTAEFAAPSALGTAEFAEAVALGTVQTDLSATTAAQDLLFEESSGTTLADNSGNGNTGTIVGGVLSYQALQVLNSATYSIQITSSQYIDVQAGVDLAQATTPFTRIFGFRGQSITSRVLYQHGVEGVTPNYTRLSVLGGVLYLQYRRQGDATVNPIIGSTTLTLNTNYLIGLSRNSSGVWEVTLDGNSEGTADLSGVVFASTAADEERLNRSAIGYFARPRLYEVALTPAQIADIDQAA